MGLRSLIQNATRTAFNAIGDIPVTATYHHTSWGDDFDPATGMREDTGTDESVSIVLMDFMQREDVVDAFEPGDKRGLLRQADLAGGVPDLDDYLVVSGVTWHIIAFSSDPADATWTLHLRRA